MARQAWVNLRYTLPERRAAVCEGLRRVGFEPREGLTRTPADGDLLLSWNRIGEADEVARIFMARGLPVLILENSTWGNTLAGRNWWTLCRGWHNVSGTFPVGGPERWDSLGVELKPFRTGEGEVVILASRGIGPGAYRMPGGWAQRQGGRVRAHPGRNANVIPLAEDLANCKKVICWGSAAGVQALMLGIPVESHQREWIGEQKNTDEDRLRMFRELAWAQSEYSEIRSGEAFERLLSW